ncbi:MAG TPA: radical SAM protein [Anaerolineales bacterium]|nr:radical SAM protein [Anaerolineales bacterium]
MDARDPFTLNSKTFTPAYLALAESGELQQRADVAIASLESCKTCPRGCGTNRLNGYSGTCKIKRYAVVSSAFPHMGEEDCLRGWQGSGTIFFSQCSLRCVFCQNVDISQTTAGNETTAAQLAKIMLGLQRKGCHNINLVTPDHVVPQILEALVLAVQDGLRMPIVYNTSGYTSLKALAWLDGVVDIYMPDYKMADPQNAKRYLQAKDYPSVAARAIQEMHRQAGDLKLDEHGLAKRGVLVRHLVMPADVADTHKLMQTLSEISPNIYLNIMRQYHPAAKVNADKYAEINRRVTAEEMAQTYQIAEQAGLWRFDQRN